MNGTIKSDFNVFRASLEKNVHHFQRNSSADIDMLKIINMEIKRYNSVRPKYKSNQEAPIESANAKQSQPYGQGA